jgi:hypothetical protein
MTRWQVRKTTQVGIEITTKAALAIQGVDDHHCLAWYIKAASVHIFGF